MSAADKMRASQATNQERLASKAAGDGLDDPDARMAALSGLPKRTSPAQPKTGDADKPKAARAKKAAPAKASAPESGKARDALIATLTGRSQPGAAADTKVAAVIDADTAAALKRAEVAVFTRTGKRLIRSAVMTEAARRVSTRPDSYADMEGRELAARVPSALHAALLAVTNFAEPKLQYSPRLGSAIAQIIAELEGGGAGTAEQPNERTTEQTNTATEAGGELVVDLTGETVAGSV